MANRKVVTKAYLVNKVAKETGTPVVQVSFIYDILFDTIEKELRKANDVSFPGIGRIVFVSTKDSLSNMTGQHIPPHKRIKFKVNMALARYVRVSTREYKI